MRFESLTLEHYGRAKEATLNFPVSPGLNVIFGPNEAGKSTSLEAVSDFLYGVPERSARGQIFGADKIAIRATIVRADGTRLALKRRKGRGRTLTDASGRPVDEAVLGLGATGRERFASLFGLNHASLRSGGEHLLAADGDIGRLILEAGGGLRSLVETVDGLRAQASALFETRKSKDRLFYIALSAFEEAEKTVKDGLMTREHYDKARQRLKAAQDVVAARRARLNELTEERLRLARLARVAPKIREFDRLAAHLASFGDVAPLRGDFAAGCHFALDALKRREEALGEAESRCKTLRAKIDALAPPAALIEAEAAIRDAGEKATHVAKARVDRANREAELAEIGKALNALRMAVGIADDAALEAAAPVPEAIRSVQKLATAARRGALAQIESERQRELKTKEAISLRQEGRRTAGRDQPFGAAAADFAELPALAAAAEAKRAQLARIAAEIDEAVRREGFGALAELYAFACPDAALIQAQIERRGAVEADLGRLRDAIAAKTEERDRAGADIARLRSGAGMPSSEAILAARQERDSAWSEIRARYLSPGGAAVTDRPLEARLADVELKQARTREADDLADRKSTEAERVAALDLAERGKADAVSALAALTLRHGAFLKEAATNAAAWADAWPDAAARFEDLGRLKRAAAERTALLLRHADWRAQSDALCAQEAEIAQRLQALEQAEAKLKLSPSGSLAARKSATSQGVKAHEDAYGDFRRDETALQDAELKLGRIEDEHRRLVEAEAAWGASWGPAVAALGLDGAADPERANEIATLWAGASGHFATIRLTRNRLKGMDKDEAALLSLVRGIAPRLDFVLPEDGVAAAHMLVARADAARKTLIERDSLAAQLSAFIIERDEQGRLAGLARDSIVALSAEAGASPDALGALAARCEEHRATVRKLEGLGETIIELGDGLPIETLRAQWADRDPDEIGAALEQHTSKAGELSDSLDEALAAQQDRSREFEALLSADSLNAAVAERERAAAAMHGALERYVEIALAEELLRAAMDRLRDERKDPLIRRAGELFAAATAGAFAGVDTDVDEDGLPVVRGRRSDGAEVPVKLMSDGVRDQLYLAFRIASIEGYARAAEPLPFIADDLLVHFDDERSAAAMRLLAELGRATQVLLFTHHRSLRAAAAPLVAQNLATIIDLGG
jgi:uncharacterized protein YhaN